MRGRAAVLFSLVVLLSLPAAADCNESLIYSGQFRSSYLDLAIDGNDLWTATSYGVSLFDRSVDPPVLVTSIAIPGITRAVRVVGGTIYAASGTRVYVIRKSGARSLAITGAYEAGATVNDFIATPLDLYVATTAGLQQVDTLSLQKTGAVLATSGTNVTSLALNNATLYAADGDSSIEVFNITVPTLPQHTGTIESLPRVTTVEATPTRLYASDGLLSTDVFFSGTTTRATTANGGTTAVAILKDDVVLTASSGHIRAIDWTTAATPVDLFAADVVPNGGTINRISAMQIAGGRLYVAAGDAGLLTFDVSTFAAPFAVRSYPFAAMTSTAWVDGKLYASRSAGGISEFVRSITTGYLTAARQWDANVHTLWDGASGFLLSSSGKTLYDWTLNSTTPILITSAALSRTIVSASMHGAGSATVALDDGSVWTADLSQLSPTPQRVANITADSLRWTSANQLAFARAEADGTTTIGWMLPDSTITKSSVSGITTVPIAAAGTYAAVFTFTGINVSDSRSPGTFVLPGSNTPIARRLAINGTRLLELTDTALVVWDLTTRKVVRRISLSAEGTSLSADVTAAMATASGIEIADIDAAQQAPALLGTRNGNSYYRKIAAGTNRLYLGTTSSIEVYETTYGTAPHHLVSLRPPGTIDFAANDSGVFTLSSTNVVTAYSREGALVAQRALDVDSTTQPLVIHTVAGAVWVAISRGCTTGGCEKKTLVLDPRTLAQMSVLDGGAVDVATSGTRAFAIFDLPAEVRTYDVTAPLTPALIAKTAAAGTRTPVSISFANNTLYVAGDKLYAYDPLLSQRTDNLDTFQADATGATSFSDQRVRGEGTCALFSRGLQPQWLSLPQLTPQSAPSPAPVRSVAQTPGRFWLLTDDSIELWSTGGTNPPAPRHRAAEH